MRPSSSPTAVPLPPSPPDAVPDPESRGEEPASTHAPSGSLPGRMPSDGDSESPPGSAEHTAASAVSPDADCSAASPSLPSDAPSSPQADADLFVFEDWIEDDVGSDGATSTVPRSTPSPHFHPPKPTRPSRFQSGHSSRRPLGCDADGGLDFGAAIEIPESFDVPPPDSPDDEPADHEDYVDVDVVAEPDFGEVQVAPSAESLSATTSTTTPPSDSPTAPGFDWSATISSLFSGPSQSRSEEGTGTTGTDAPRAPRDRGRGLAEDEDRSGVRVFSFELEPTTTTASSSNTPEDESTSTRSRSRQFGIRMRERTRRRPSRSRTNQRRPAVLATRSDDDELGFPLSLVAFPRLPSFSFVTEPETLQFHIGASRGWDDDGNRVFRWCVGAPTSEEDEDEDVDIPPPLVAGSDDDSDDDVPPPLIDLDGLEEEEVEKLRAMGRDWRDDDLPELVTSSSSEDDLPALDTSSGEDEGVPELESGSENEDGEVAGVRSGARSGRQSGGEGGFFALMRGAFNGSSRRHRQQHEDGPPPLESLSDLPPPLESLDDLPPPLAPLADFLPVLVPMEIQDPDDIQDIGEGRTRTRRRRREEEQGEDDDLVDEEEEEGEEASGRRLQPRPRRTRPDIERDARDDNDDFSDEEDAEFNIRSIRVGGEGAPVRRCRTAVFEVIQHEDYIYTRRMTRDPFGQVGLFEPLVVDAGGRPQPLSRLIVTSSDGDQGMEASRQTHRVGPPPAAAETGRDDGTHIFKFRDECSSAEIRRADRVLKFLRFLPRVESRGVQTDPPVVVRVSFRFLLAFVGGLFLVSYVLWRLDESGEFDALLPALVSSSDRNEDEIEDDDDVPVLVAFSDEEESDDDDLPPALVSSSGEEDCEDEDPDCPPALVSFSDEDDSGDDDDDLPTALM